MQIIDLCWHDYLLLVSAIGCMAGLGLIFSAKQTEKDEFAETEKTLFKMIFSYWLVYCIAFVGGKAIALSNSEIILMSLQLTAALSYFLTLCCILALPLYRFSMQQVE